MLRSETPDRAAKYRVNTVSALFAQIEAVPRLGELLALTSGLVWAVSVILFRVIGRTVHPLALNLFKNIFAGWLVILTMTAWGLPLLPKLHAADYGLFLLSGIIGIGISDTLFLKSLNILGASRTAIVDCLYSPFVIGLSFLFLAESMTASQIFGVILIISAVLTVTRNGGDERQTRRNLVFGVVLGALAMLTVAAGIVMVKPALARVPFLWAVLFRLLGGAGSLGIFLSFHPRRRTILAPLFQMKNWKALVPASFFGGYLSLIFWMGGMKLAFASVAAALNQLNTIFIVILAAVFLKEKVTAVRVVAIAVAFIGAYLASHPF